MLISPSEEQKTILKKILNSNLTINAVAGSGKTTTNLHIANAYKTSNILLLTYNSKLKMETRMKIDKYKIENLETHSYHSFGVKYYDRMCFTDLSIKNIINLNLPKLKSFKYDIIIIDEAQDMTPLFYEFALKILADNDIDNPRLVISGDLNQSIYDFNKADNRYLKYADKLFLKDTWDNATLSKSFRITSETASFINNCMYGYEYIKSNKITNIRPRYVICDTFGGKYGTSSSILSEFKNIISLGYKPDDIFILAPSIRTNNSPVRILANQISEMNIPIYVPTSDSENIDESVIENKLVISTIHQSKGRERLVVFLFGFDNSYFKFFKKDADPTKCPNELYVATTRALERLIIFHHYSNDYLPFLNKDLLSKYTNFNNGRLFIKNNESESFGKIAVTDLIRHLTMDTVQTCKSFLNIQQIRSPSKMIKIPIKSSQVVGNESVSDITGTAIPAYYEYRLKQKMTIFNGIPTQFIKNNKSSTKQTLISDFSSGDCMIDTDDDKPISKNKEPQKTADTLIVEKIKLNEISESELLYLANRWLSYCSGYIFKLKQIKNFNWLSHENLLACLDRMDTLGLSKSTIFEKKVSVERDKIFKNKDVAGYMDCFDPVQNSVFEFKCTERIEDEHLLQVALYMYLYRISHGKVKETGNIIDLLNKQLNINTNETRFYVYNILSDELIEIKAEQGVLKEMISYLVERKYAQLVIDNDEQFLNKMNEIKTKYIIN